MTNALPAVVIGAGPAGIGVSACLHRRGVEHVVLERAQRIAPKWHQHYERLHLHTYRGFSHLPFKKWNRGTPRYPSREQVVSYLDDYAREFGVEPEFGQEVRSAQRVNGHWRIETGDQTWQAINLVIATGYCGFPVVPTWPGQDAFKGSVLHSKDYRTGTLFEGQRVLVVGAGNSGAEIAIDLVEQGAEATLCIRSPTHVVARDVNGVIPAQFIGMFVNRLPRKVADAIGLLASKSEFGDLAPWGITRPKLGPISMIIERGRVPLIDVGTIELIRSGDIRVVPGIDSFTETGCVFVDGREVDFDAVVLATGYRAGLDAFLDGAEHYLNDRGFPKVHGARAEPPDPYFIGFENPPTGLLHEIHDEAKEVAAKIANTL